MHRFFLLHCFAGSLFPLICLSSCSGSGQKSETSEPPEKDSIVQETVTAVKKSSRTNFDFLCSCDSLDIWQGSIQGVTPSDSSGMYVMASCNPDPGYDVIVYTKDVLPLTNVKDKKKHCLADTIPGADYYVFEVRREKNRAAKAPNAYNYIFPDKVEVYKMYDDGWYLINTEWVRSVEELGKLKLKTLFTK
ncbi:MAG TPA: hypothetical protein VI112_14630 [Bacteroidia bacterium]|jgi:hypothetical protein